MKTEIVRNRRLSTDINVVSLFDEITYIINSIDNTPQSAKLIKIGKAVLLTNRPAKVDKGTPITTVAKKPIIADPIPAMCPIGCIANALMFPKMNPKANHNNAILNTNTSKGGFVSPL